MKVTHTGTVTSRTGQVTVVDLHATKTLYKVVGGEPMRGKGTRFNSTTGDPVPFAAFKWLTLDLRTVVPTKDE